jgi:hypothetical protein
VASRMDRVPRGNDGSDSPQNRTRAAWWNRGHALESDDYALHPDNLGLGHRERKAITDENVRPYGMRMYAENEIIRKALEADHRPGRMERLARWARGEPWDGRDRPARGGW